MKQIIILVIVLLGLAGLYKYLSYQPNSKTSDAEANLIVYWGEGCPHCEKVKEYIANNKIENKIKISFKEVYYNKANQKLLEETVKKCPEIDTKQGIGVPLAFDPKNQKCLYGDEPIIKWLSAQ